MSFKKILISLSATIAGLALFVVPAFAAPFTNGSFETGNLTNTVFTTLFATDSTSIPGWTVTSGSVDYIGSYWQSSDGSRDLDMSGNEAGAVSQTFDTVTGGKYAVTFDMAGNPDGGPTVKTMTVDAGGTPVLYTFDSSLSTHSAMGWLPKTFSFTATGTSTTLTFTSTTETPFGPALDNVMVNQVLPTNMDQCKKSGWMSFGVFKNQGDCVSFVATGGKNPPAGQ